MLKSKKNIITKNTAAASLAVIRGGLVCLSVLGLVIANHGVATAATKSQVKRIVVEEAVAQGVPPALALALARVESGFNDRALSHKGARGVMQIMPATARGEFGVSANRLWDARLNVKLGLVYLKRLQRQYGHRWDLALSHYNGGTLKGRGANARAHGYTRKYVRSVMAWRSKYERNVTTLALARDANGRGSKTGSYDVAYAGGSYAADRANIADYWLMEDDHRVKKDWRHYLRVADKWLQKAKEQAVTGAAKTPASLVSYAAASESSVSDRVSGRFSDDDLSSLPKTTEVRGASWQEIELPSRRWERRVENRRVSFRSKLTAIEGNV